MRQVNYRLIILHNIRYRKLIGSPKDKSAAPARMADTAPPLDRTRCGCRQTGQIMISVARCHTGECNRTADTRSVGEWGSMATSPEIIHGTTPARDLFSFLTARGQQHQPCEGTCYRFSTTVFPCLCVAWRPPTVGKLWMAVNKPAMIRNVRTGDGKQLFVRGFHCASHYSASLMPAALAV